MKRVDGSAIFEVLLMSRSVVMLFRKVVLSPMAIPRPVLSFSRVRTFVVETPRFKAVNYGSPELHLGLQLHPFCPKKPNPFFSLLKVI